MSLSIDKDSNDTSKNGLYVMGASITLLQRHNFEKKRLCYDD